MKPIRYIDRITKKVEQEKVFGEKALHFLYQDSFLAKCLRPLITRLPLVSALYGGWQKSSWTKKKILPFIKEYQMDPTEFLDPPNSFSSFNDFFIRHLKKEARPISQSGAVIPADGRYLFFQDLSSTDGFMVKGERFSLSSLLENEELASEYNHGSMVLARLCPTDYHRFHFPCDGTPSISQLINGFLYSVNPIAIKKDIEIFTKNKRTLCRFGTSQFGRVLLLEVGATNVGSIHQTYQQKKEQKKGDEKGYFSFGASSLILLFLPNAIEFDQDLVDATAQGLEIRCLMGQSMGASKKRNLLQELGGSFKRFT